MKLYHLQCEQFQFVDKWVRLDEQFCRALSKYFSGKDGSAAIGKIGPYTYRYQLAGLKLRNINTLQWVS